MSNERFNCCSSTNRFTTINNRGTGGNQHTTNKQPWLELCHAIAQATATLPRVRHGKHHSRDATKHRHQYNKL